MRFQPSIMQYPTHVQAHPEDPQTISRGGIYSTTTAAKMAAKAAAMDAEPRTALLPTASTEVVDAAVDDVGVGVLLPATTEVPLEPLDPVEAAPDPVVVLDEPPMPPPWDGERPPPDEARSVADAAEETEEAALERDADAEDSELAGEEVEASLLEDDPDPDSVDAVELEAAAEVEDDPDEAEDEELEETSLQERSKRGVVLRVEPTIPRLGEGVVASASWRVNHQVLTLPRRGHATSSQ